MNESQTLPINGELEKAIMEKASCLLALSKFLERMRKENMIRIIETNWAERDYNREEIYSLNAIIKELEEDLISTIEIPQVKINEVRMEMQNS
jgi:hypothetical protein